MNLPKLGTFATAAALALVATSALAGSHDRSFQAVKAEAEKKGLPILMKIGTEWCSSCKAFDSAAEEASFHASITEDAVLFQIDAEKGQGAEIARQYNVAGYPTFILANAEGQTMDRWMGFDHYKNGPEAFLSTLEEALLDPMTASARLDRFKESPTELDARKLGDLRLYEGYVAEAIAYYNRASQLGPQSDIDYDLRIFGATVRGKWSNLYGASDVVAAADAVYASADAKPQAMFEVLHSMQKISKKTAQPTLFHPYLKAAMERTVNAEGEKIAKIRRWHAPNYSLYIEKDADKAVALRRASLPEDWETKANQLNNFAWWCFEAGVNLEEAEQLARRGVELAAEGSEKANILDTLAELCNVNDNCAMAVEYIRLAIEQDPKNEYFRKQLTRFEEILAVAD